MQFMAAPPGSSFRSPLFRFMAWLIVSALPVGAFLAVQISFLRYQSEAITTLHQVCLALALAALSWFHTRHWLAGRKRAVIRASAFRLRIALNIVISLLVLAFAVVYAGVPSAERTTVGALPLLALQSEVSDTYEQWNAAGAAWAALNGAVSQPLDLVACPWLGFGCRFLRLDHRTLLANTPPAHVLTRLRTGKSDDLEGDLAHVEGLSLSDRTLRFADFTNSRLYAADLMSSDLRGARIVSAQLQHAKLTEAQLQNANLAFTELQGADFTLAELQGADLAFAELRGARLAGAELQGAYLGDSRLECVDLAGAQLQGGFLAAAQLRGARLSGTQLQGAELRHARLQGADLRGARLWSTPTTYSNFGFADLRGASWQTIDEKEWASLRQIIDVFPTGEDWQRDSKARLERLILSDEQSGEPPEFALSGVLLVNDVDDPRWQRLDRTRLTADERAYDEALVPFLADLARTDPQVARSLAHRLEREEFDRVASLSLHIPMEEVKASRAGRLARGLLDRAGPALPEDVRERLSRIASQPQAKD